jgi:O-antigen ligase
LKAEKFKLINITNKVFVYCSSVVFFAAAACYAYWQELYFLIAPLALVIAILLIQHPQFLLYLLILSIPWSVEFNFNPNLGTDLPDEPLMLLAALSVIVYSLFHWEKIQQFKLHVLIAIISLQFLWAIITVITSTDFIVSIKYLLAKSWYLLAFVGLPLSLFKDEGILKRTGVLLLSSMMIVMIVTLIRHGINCWTFEKINDSLHPFFRNHVNYSSLLVFMVPLQIAIIKLSSSKKIRNALYVLVIITIVATYFTYARGAWLALLAGFIAYWLIQKRLLVFSFLFFLSAVVATVFWLQSNDRFVNLSNDYKTTIFHSDFREHLIATYELKDLSNAERIYRWIAGIRMIKDQWETGFGPSTFYHQYKSYTLPAFKTYVSDNREQSTVHNYFLLLLIEQGVMGCVLFIALVAALLWYAQKIYFRTDEKFWKVVVAAVTSILIMQCVVNFLSDMIETDKVGSVFYLCVAVIIIADIKTGSSNSSTDIKSIS